MKYIGSMIFIATLMGFSEAFTKPMLTETKSEDQDCPEIDYQNRFGPPKDQGFHQICWAMAASALLEEQACLQAPQHCKLPISPVDITSCDKKIGHKKEEGIPKRALECALQKGACEAGLAPFVDFHRTSSTLSYLLRDSRFTKSRIFSLFNKIKLRQTDKTYRTYLSEFSSNRQVDKILKDRDLSEFLKEFRDTFKANDDTDQEVIYKVMTSKDDIDFIDKTLIPQACQKNRIHFNGPLRVFTKLYPEVTPLILPFYKVSERKSAVVENLRKEPQIGTIIERLKTGRSLSLGICSQNFSSIENIALMGVKCAAGHVIVANALRRNPSTKACEVHLLDSRLQSSTIQFNGWFSLKDIAASTYLIEQLE